MSGFPNDLYAIGTLIGVGHRALATAHVTDDEDTAFRAAIGDPELGWTAAITELAEKDFQGLDAAFAERLRTRLGELGETNADLKLRGWMLEAAESEARLVAEENRRFSGLEAGIGTFAGVLLIGVLVSSRVHFKLKDGKLEVDVLFDPSTRLTSVLSKAAVLVDKPIVRELLRRVARSLGLDEAGPADGA